MTGDLSKRLLAETVGTFALTFVGAAAICTDAYSGGQVGLLGIAVAHGLILSIMITATAHISGAHVNPAVTLAALLSRAIGLRHAMCYVVVQLIGAVLAGLMLTATFAADVWQPVVLGTPVLGPGVAPGTGIFIEAILTFFLVFTMLQVAMDPRAPRHVYGFAIGLVLTANILVGGPLTGAAVNPARAFGPALASWTWNAHHVYWIGPFLGALIASVVYGALQPAVGNGPDSPDGPDGPEASGGMAA